MVEVESYLLLALGESNKSTIVGITIDSNLISLYNTGSLVW